MNGCVFELLWITLLFNLLWSCFQFFWVYTVPRSGIAQAVIILFLIFEELLFCIEIIPFYIPNNSSSNFQFFYLLVTCYFLFFFFFFDSSLMDVRWYSRTLSSFSLFCLLFSSSSSFLSLSSLFSSFLSFSLILCIEHRTRLALHFQAPLWFWFVFPWWLILDIGISLKTYLISPL